MAIVKLLFTVKLTSWICFDADCFPQTVQRKLFSVGRSSCLIRWCNFSDLLLMTAKHWQHIARSTLHSPVFPECSGSISKTWWLNFDKARTISHNYSDELIIPWLKIVKSVDKQIDFLWRCKNAQNNFFSEKLHHKLLMGIRISFHWLAQLQLKKEAVRLQTVS